MPTRNKTSPRIGVAGILRRADGAVLLAQRGQEPSRGRWAFPGGSLAAQETLASAVAREFFEETSLRVRSAGLLYVAEIMRPGVHFVVLDYWVETDEWNPQAQSDADALMWAHPGDLDDLPLAEGMDACFKNPEVRQALHWV